METIVKEVTKQDFESIQTNGLEFVNAFDKDKINQHIKENLKKYQSYINYHIFKKEEDDIILNSGVYETSLLMSNLFERTKKDIKMVVGRFSGQVSSTGSYIDQLSKCINNNFDIEIILLKRDYDIQSPALALLLEQKEIRNNISLYLATETTENILRSIYNNLSETVHFTIFDNDKYRFETSPEKIIGFASFHSPIDTLVLLENYERIKKTAEKI